jgi:hypothetical protein
MICLHAGTVEPFDDCDASACGANRTICENDSACKQALGCVNNAINSNKQCDASCVTSCVQSLAAPAKQKAMDALNCLLAACDTKDNKDNSNCVPSECVDSVDACRADKSCSEAGQCVRGKLALTGSCDSDCVKACKSNISGQSATLFTTASSCLVTNFDSKCGNYQADSETLKTCDGVCSEATKSCLKSPSCNKGLNCLASCQNDTTCIYGCFQSSGSDEQNRKLLGKASLCLRSCLGSNHCAGNSTKSACEGQSTCAWNSKCRPALNPCKVASTETECSALSGAVSCRWNDGEAKCESDSVECKALNDADCESNSNCILDGQCIAAQQPCVADCADAEVNCLRTSGCTNALICLSSGGSSDVCAVSISDDDSLKAWKKLLKCRYECAGSQPDARPGPADDCNASACNTITSACTSVPACANAFNLAKQLFKQLHHLGDDAIDTLASQGSLGATDKLKLKAAVTCMRNFCADSDVSSACKAPAQACNGSSICKKALRKLDSGDCGGNCVANVLSKMSADSVDRDLANRVYMCASEVRTKIKCANFTSMDTCNSKQVTRSSGLAVQCEWREKCIPKADGCRAHTDDSACTGANGCEWDEATGCSAVANACYVKQTSGDCAAANCVWTAGCHHEHACDDKCSDQAAVCLQNDQCSNAWDCFRSTSEHSLRDAANCARTAFTSATSDGFKAFTQYSLCATKCAKSTACDNKCRGARYACLVDTGCAAMAACVANSDVKDEASCLASTSPNTASLDKYWQYAMCRRNCDNDGSCKLVSDSDSCDATDGCYWSQRCVAADTRSCNTFQDETSCTADSSSFCAWDSYSQSCVGNSTKCYNPSVLDVLSTDTGDKSFLVPDAEPCKGSCRREGQCRADDRCDRKCDQAYRDCFGSSVCLGAWQCMRDCKHNGTCNQQCMSDISSDSAATALLQATLACLGDCKLKLGQCSECAGQLKDCTDDSACAATMLCIARGSAFGKCDKDCMSNCLQSSSAQVSLLYPALSCIAGCSNRDYLHLSCSRVNKVEAVDVIKGELCKRTSAVKGNSSTAGANSGDTMCQWNATSSRCDMPIPVSAEKRKAVCDANPDNCFACCRYNKKMCTGNSCLSTYKSCASSCAASESSQVPPGTVFLKFKMSVGVSNGNQAANDADLEDLTHLIADAFANGQVSPDNVRINDVQSVTAGSGRRRASNDNVVISYTLVTSASTQVQIADSASSADYSSVASSVGGTSASNDLTGVSTSTSTTLAAATNNGLCNITTPLGTVPAGAALTEAQKSTLATDFLAAAGLPLTVTVTIDVNSTTNTISATRESPCLSDSDLQNEGGLLLTITFTDSNGNEQSTTTVTSSSTTVDASSATTKAPKASSSSAPVGAVVGGAVAGVVLIAVVVVVVVRRRRRTSVASG